MQNISALKDDGAGQNGHFQCDHRGRISSEFGAIRCTDCLCQLIMTPQADGEFRLEWLSPVRMALRSCAA